MPTPAQAVACDITNASPEELLARIDEVERWWQACSFDNVIPWDGLARKLHDLRPAILTEFQFEEAREQALMHQKAPGASRRHLDQLIRTHAVLLADLDKMVMRLRICEPGIECWNDAEEALVKLLAKLRAPR